MTTELVKVPNELQLVVQLQILVKNGTPFLCSGREEMEARFGYCDL
jgi:hypothetical protein